MKSPLNLANMADTTKSHKAPFKNPDSQPDMELAICL